MSNYSLVNLLLLCSTLFFAAVSLFILLKKTKEKRFILKAIESNNTAYEEQFTNEEEQLRKTLGSELGTKLNNVITEIITLEKDSYKKLCTLFIEHQAEAIEVLPFTMNQITSAYIRCLSQVVTLLKDKAEAETVSLQENINEEEQLSQHEALIDQLRSEKQVYSDKYKEAHHLLVDVYLKYKDKLEINNVETVDDMNINEMASLLNIEPIKIEGEEI